MGWLRYGLSVNADIACLVRHITRTFSRRMLIRRNLSEPYGQVNIDLKLPETGLTLVDRTLNY